ncbi:hypothetical protein CIK90_04540 [Prevotella sp. P5-126]|nr:hypothetical protein CIK90_04540 [Prevotella sp. P5-126]OYP45608.1 hypothetical protein CIK96_08015 [Prevotella sp. P4-98]
MAFGQKSIIGSLEFKRNLDGFFWGLPTARNLWRKSFFYMAFGQKSIIGSSEFIRILRIYGIMAG